MRKTFTIGGLHGTGKSSVADVVAKHFGFRRASVGVLFRELAKERGLSLEEFSRIAEDNEEIDRELDARQKREAEKGNIIIDSQLAAWMTKEYADFRILLTAPLDVRVARIAERDNIDFDEAMKETLVREESEKERYHQYYGIDITDLSIYDLIINTEKFDKEGVAAVIISALDLFMKG